jgi:hypothetical protein
MSNRITEIGRMSDRVMHFALMLLFASFSGKEFGIDKFFIKHFSNINTIKRESIINAK